VSPTSPPPNQGTLGNRALQQGMGGVGVGWANPRLIKRLRVAGR